MKCFDSISECVKLWEEKRDCEGFRKCELACSTPESWPSSSTETKTSGERMVEDCQKAKDTKK